jgi:hypothetical protein
MMDDTSTLILVLPEYHPLWLCHVPKTPQTSIRLPRPSDRELEKCSRFAVFVLIWAVTGSEFDIYSE